MMNQDAQFFWIKKKVLRVLSRYKIYFYPVSFLNLDKAFILRTFCFHHLIMNYIDYNLLISLVTMIMIRKTK